MHNLNQPFLDMNRVRGILFIFIFVLMGAPVNMAHCADVNDAQEMISVVEHAATDNIAPDIKTAYVSLKQSVDDLEKLNTEYETKLTENADAMRETEQSTANKLLGGASIAATGIGGMQLGGMQLASAIAENRADDAAERDMAAYLATFRCDYGQGRNIMGGETDVQLPGGNNLIELKQQFIELAADLKTRKDALEMTPGIESEVILDSATMGLYDDESLGITDGAYTSLSRALSDPDGADAAEWAQQRSDTKSQLTTGAVMAGVGIIGGVVGDLLINRDAPDEQSDEIKTEYETKKRTQEQKISDEVDALQNAINQNKQKIAEYNNLLAQHQAFVATITEPDCIPKFSEYIEFINGLQPITDELSDTTNLDIPYDLDEQKSLYTQCVQAVAELQRKISECESQPYHEWINNECVDNTPVTIDTTDEEITSVTPTIISDDVELSEEDETTPVQAIDPDQCPAINPRLRSLTDKNRVGDPCTYGNVTRGVVFKRTDGTCSCSALECKPGYQVVSGMCKEIVADADGYCLRQEYDLTDENNTLKKCETYCKSVVATELGCKIKNWAIRHSVNKCICNYDSDDFAQIQQNNDAIAEQKLRNLHYYEVCGDDKGKSGGTEYCVENVFNWTNVQMLQAVALAQEYALVKHQHEIICNDETRTSFNDDYLKCTSKDEKYFYEFKFDDTSESYDADIQSDIREALCKIYNGDSSDRGYHCTGVNKTTCENELKHSAEKLGFSAYWDRSYCHLMAMVSKTNDNSIAQVPGIDSYIFYAGIQIQANTTIITRLQQYISSIMGTRLQSFSCVNNPRQMSEIKDHSVNGSTDDVLRCTINGDTPIDFVFDDMSELYDAYHKGGMQNIDCRVIGGQYNGRECMYLNEEQCNKLRELNADSCPFCQGIFWDGTLCRMPSAAAATELENNIEVYSLVGAAAAGVVVTILTGGTATPALAVLAVETVGAGIEIATTAMIHNAGEEFLNTSQQCQDATCAESMLKSDLQRMANLANDLPDAVVNGIDAELARLIELIPADSQLYQDIIKNGSSTADNQKGFFDTESWEPEQVWRAVGITLQLASIIESIVSWGVSKLTRATTALERRINNAYDLAPSPQRPTGGAPGGGAIDDALHTATNTIRNGTIDNPLTIEELRTGNGLEQNISDIFDSVNGEIYINRRNMTGSEMRSIQRIANAKGWKVNNNFGDDVLFYTKNVDATDATHTTSTIDDAADQATNIPDNATTVNDVPDIATLRNRASSDFDKFLTEFKETGNSTLLPKDRLSDAEWDALSRALESDGVRLRPGMQNGELYMAFDDIPNHPAAVARQQARAAKQAADVNDASDIVDLSDNSVTPNTYADDILTDVKSTDNTTGSSTDTSSRTATESVSGNTTRTNSNNTNTINKPKKTVVNIPSQFYDIGNYSKGWVSHNAGADAYKTKPISYPGEEEVVKQLLEEYKDYSAQSYVGAIDNQIVITYDNNLNNIQKKFNDYVQRKSLEIGNSTKGWKRIVLEGSDRFKAKEISYYGEADGVRRILESDKNTNLAYLGVKDNKIIITYKSDLSSSRPIFDRYLNDTSATLLRNRASSNFDTYLNDFKETGRSTLLTYDRLSDAEWAALNRALEPDGVRLRLGRQNGELYMAFDDIPNHPAAIARQQARAAKQAADVNDAPVTNSSATTNRTTTESVTDNAADTGSVDNSVTSNTQADNIKNDVESTDDVPNSSSDAVSNHTTAESVTDIATLRNRVSSDFEKELNEFKNNGSWRSYDKNILTDAEWDALNRDLESDGVRLSQSLMGTIMRFDDIPNHPAAVARQQARAAKQAADVNDVPVTNSSATTNHTTTESVTDNTASADPVDNSVTSNIPVDNVVNSYLSELKYITSQIDTEKQSLRDTYDIFYHQFLSFFKNVNIYSFDRLTKAYLEEQGYGNYEYMFDLFNKIAQEYRLSTDALKQLDQNLNTMNVFNDFVEVRDNLTSLHGKFNEILDGLKNHNYIPKDKSFTDEMTEIEQFLRKVEQSDVINNEKLLLSLQDNLDELSRLFEDYRDIINEVKRRTLNPDYGALEALYNVRGKILNTYEELENSVKKINMELIEI